MSRQDRLRAVVEDLRHRALRDSAVAWGLRAVIAISAWTVVVGLGSRWLDGMWTPPLLLGGAAAAVVAAVAGWALSRPSLTLVARTADARLHLHERLATALTKLGSADDPLADALVDDAVAAAQRSPLPLSYPLRRHRRHGMIAAAAAMAAALTLALPRPGSTVQASSRATADAAVQAQATDTVTKQEQASRTAAAKSPADPRLKQLDQALIQAQRDLQRSTSPEQTLRRLSQLQDQLQPLADSGQQAAAAAQAAGDALRSDAATSGIAADLASGDLSKAAADLSALGAGLDRLSPTQRASLAATLSRASAAAGTDPALSGALEAAGSALRSGDAAGARAGLGDASRRTAGIAAAASADQQVAVARAAVENAREAAAGQADRDSTGQSQGNGNGNGNGSGQGQGQGQVGGGSGGQGGAGGQGQGGGAGGSASHPAQAGDQIYVAGQPGQPSVDDSTPPQLAPGQPVTLTPLNQVIGAYERSALDALDRTVVSASDRTLIHDYFASLGGPS